MPRQSLGGNAQHVIDAAVSVFARRGYRRTRMADIASEAGLSPGALYRYVESKDALLLLVFSDAAATTHTFPVATPSPQHLMKTISRRLAKLGQTPALDAALTQRATEDVRAELRSILNERYDLIARGWPLLAVVERSAIDIPEMFDRYFRGGRRPLTDKLAAYLEQRQTTGALRHTHDTRLAARFVEESLTWFAWHRHGDPDSADISEEHARAVAVDMNISALMP